MITTNPTNYPKFPNIEIVKKPDGSYDGDTLLLAFAYIQHHAESVVVEELEDEAVKRAQTLYPPGVSRSSAILRLCFGQVLEESGIVQVRVISKK